MAWYLAGRSFAAVCAKTQWQLSKFIHGHHAAKVALEQIEPLIVRASPIPARIYNEHRSRFFTPPHQIRTDGAEVLSSDPDDREEAPLNSQEPKDTNARYTPLTRCQQACPNGEQPQTQPRTANAQLSLQRLSASSVSQPSRRFVVASVVPSSGINIRTSLVRSTEQPPTTLQQARLQGILPLSARPPALVRTQQIALLSPSVRPQQPLGPQVRIAQSQTRSNVIWDSPTVARGFEQHTQQAIVSIQRPQLQARHSQSVAAARPPKPPRPFSMVNELGTHRSQVPFVGTQTHGPIADLDEDELELRAAKLRLEAAQLELALLEKRLANRGRSHAASEIQQQGEWVDQGVDQGLDTGFEEILRTGSNRVPVGDSSAPRAALDPSQQKPEPANRKSNNKGKNLNIYDGYAYKSEGPPKSNGTQYFSCIKKDGVKCKATGLVRFPPCHGRFINYSDGSKKFTGKHSCIKIPLLDRRRDFHNALCTAAREESGLLKKIYDRIVPKYADVAKYMMFQPNVRKNMYYHRHQVQRSWKCRVKSMKQLHEVLQTEEGKKCLLVLEDPHGIAPSVQFETVTVWVDGEPYILYFDRNYVEMLEGGDVIRIDATFASRMKISGLRQFLTVMVQAYDKAFPAIFVNMPRKTKKGYVGVFKECKNVLKNFKIRQIITDFEEGEQNALKEVFGSEVTYTSCHFHWNQAIWKNALQYGVGFPRMSKSEPEKFEIIRKIMALPLLPREHIYPTFLLIKKEASKKFGKFFVKFFEDYVEPYWFNKRGVASFCVYGELFRTNNDEESYHRDLNSLFGHTRPAVKNAHNVLLHFIQREILVLEGMKEGMSKLPRNPISAFNEKMLLEEWPKVPLRITPFHFVTKMANEMKRFLTMTEEDIDDDDDADGAGDNNKVDGDKDESDDRQNSAEEDENDDIDPAEDTQESSMSGEELSRLIQTLDERVIFGSELQSNQDERNDGSQEALTHEGDPTNQKKLLDPVPIDEVTLSTAQSIVHPTHHPETLDPANLCEFTIHAAPSIAEPTGQTVVLAPPGALKVGEVESQKSSNLKRKPPKKTQRQLCTVRDTSTDVRIRRQPKPKNFDDFVVPTKRMKRN